ncbi:MAG TPA: NADH:flavin oxidoreductase [Syntrophales bacterium]|nr:NADH:flavin oxidoreductase [Syntrophales bacterium]
MKLFEPIKVGDLDFKNRVIFAPMISRRADMQSFVSEDSKKLYLKIAKGGVAMLVIEATNVTMAVPSFLSLCDDVYIPKLKEMMDEIHSETDCKVFVQVYDPLPGYLGVEDVPVPMIQSFVDSMIMAAARGQKAGCDGVEIHAAHAYWLSCFISLRNKRKDEYGQSLEGRMKILTDIILGVQGKCGKDYPLGVRIDADEFLVGGNTLLQTTKIAPRLAELDIAYLSISAGGKYQDTWGPDDTLLRLPYPVPGPWKHVRGYSGHRATPPSYMPDGVNVYLAEAIKKSIKEYNVPVVTAGKIPTTEFAEEILQEGKADIIGICRPILCDFEWLIKSQEGREKEVVRCAYCLTCMERARLGRTECIKWNEKNVGC